MSTKAQIKTQAKPQVGTAAVRTPKTPAAVAEQETERPDIVTQFESASRLGHSFAALGVGSSAPVQRQGTGASLPEDLKAGLEHLSGLAMDDVRVHYNSAKPARLQALAYTQGTDIQVGPGQERHLPHEGWHVVQQMEGRVKPPTQSLSPLTGTMSINDDVALEREADVMGAAARTANSGPRRIPVKGSGPGVGRVIQRVREVTIGGSRSQNEHLNEAVRAKAPGFEGEMWFNCDEEARVYAAGRAEGIGVWDHQWVNLAGKGTIIWGEVHGYSSERLCRALNIRHRLKEIYSERSLHGVPAANITPADERRSSEYGVKDETGEAKGEALENYWLRSGLYMAHHAAPFLAAFRDALSGSEQNVPQGAAGGIQLLFQQLDNRDALLEIIQTLRQVRAPDPSPELTESETQIGAVLSQAKGHAEQADASGLEGYAKIPNDKNRDAKKYLQSLSRKPVEKVNSFYTNFASLAAAVEELATLHFRATATSRQRVLHEIHVGIATRRSRLGEETTAHEVWNVPRETAMLTNLRAALEVTPRPLLVIMGRAHARNLEAELRQEERVSDIVFGDADDVAALGRRRSGRRRTWTL